MKKALAVFLLLSVSLSLLACAEPQVLPSRDISCADIIAAYEAAGYTVAHGEHKSSSESTQLCYVKASRSDAPGSDYVYFTTFFSEEQAKAAAEAEKYNLAIWLYAAVCGESRWLQTGSSGKIEYSYYNPELIKPFAKLINGE